MTQNYYNAALFDLKREGNNLTLRLDLGQNTHHPLPILNLELKGCRDAAEVHSALQPWLEHIAQLEFNALQGQNAVEITFDYTIDEEVSITFDDATATFEACSLADLQRRLDWLTDIHEAHAAEYSRHERRYTRILDTLRRELRKDLDHAKKKAAFFAESHPDDPLKSQNMLGEASAYAKVLALLNQLESDRDIS